MSRKKGRSSKRGPIKAKKKNTSKIPVNKRSGLKLIASQERVDPIRVRVGGCEERRRADSEWFYIRSNRLFRLRQADAAEVSAFRATHGNKYPAKAGYFTIVYQVEPGRLNNFIFSGAQTIPHLASTPELFSGEDSGYFDRAVSCLRNTLVYQEIVDLRSVADVAMWAFVQGETGNPHWEGAQ